MNKMDEKIKQYLELKTQADTIKLEMDTLKEELKSDLGEMPKYVSPNGIISISSFPVSRVNTKLLEDFIGKDNMDKVKKTSTTTRCEIISHDTAEKKSEFMASKVSYEGI